MNKIKILNISLAVGLVFSILLGMTDFEARCDDLRENVFRLHIIANSDSEEDQNLKLAVRDAVLREESTLFLGADDYDGAVDIASENTALIESIVRRTVEEKGFDCDIEVSVGDSFFDTRVYDDFTLPAGVYKALKIKIGKAEGKNWWCVLFPNICVGSAGKLTDTATTAAAKTAQNGTEFVIRFKIVEIYETLKQKIIDLF